MKTEAFAEAARAYDNACALARGLILDMERSVEPEKLDAKQQKFSMACQRHAALCDLLTAQSGRAP
jgi:hypothetical protein